jgi:hypothetical protein
MPDGAPLSAYVSGFVAVAETVKVNAVPTCPLIAAPVTTGAVGAIAVPVSVLIRLPMFGVPSPVS